MMSFCCIKGLFCTFSMGCICIVIFKIIYNFLTFNKIFLALKNKRVVITGGSSGIGLSLAKYACSYGAHVTIIGRSEDKLKAAKNEICGIKNESFGSIEIMSVDVSADYETLKTSLQPKIGRTDILINCAGASISRTFLDSDPLDIEGQIRLNYLGSANVTKIFLPSLIENADSSSVVFISSMAGQIGLFGFGAYSASKFALRGLAESLRMEVSHLGVNVTLAFPPDTRTPGFENEQIGKPETTKRLSESAGLIEPDEVAKCIWSNVLRKKFFCSLGLDGWLLTQLTYGMVLPGSILETLSLIVLSPLLRIVAIGYGMWIRYVVHTTNTN